jgi:hypothetical protein
VFAEAANAVNRLISITEVCGSTRLESCQFELMEDDGLEANDNNQQEDFDSRNCFNFCSSFPSPANLEESLFQLSLSDEGDDPGIETCSDDEDEYDERRLVFVMGLAAPGKSSLAKRRALKPTRLSISSVDSGNISGCSPPDFQCCNQET